MAAETSEPKSGGDEGDTLKTLIAATKGLKFMSESDKPVKAFVWDEAVTKDATAPLDALLAAVAGVDKATVKTLGVAEFFKTVTDVQEWMGHEEKATAAQFAALVETLGKTLADAKAFRIESGGAVVDAYVVGKDGAGRWAGVSTQLVET